MITNTFLNPSGLFDASLNGFSHIGVAPKSCQFIFVAGQWASNTSQELVSENFEEQVVQSIINLKTALNATGLSEQNIIKLTIYLANYGPQMKEIILKVARPLLKLTAFPVSTIVPVPLLATHPKSLIEIEAIATSIL